MSGGAELYKDSLKIADKLYITEVDLTVEGDAFFPKFDKDLWKETSREANTSAQGLSFGYVTYTRK